MVKVHLVDGTFELFRHYFGAPEAKTSDGTEIGAVRGLMRSMASLLAQEDVTHLAVAFDHVIESFRNDLFDGYKTGEGLEPELGDQFPIAEDAMRAMGIVTWPMVEFEADDGIATGAFRYKDIEGVEQVVIASPDKDLTQCVEGQKVVTWDRIRDTWLDEKGVVAKFGIEPASIPDYLALVGDTADGIPGLPRWGSKSTSTILAAYHHLENIPKDSEQWCVKVRGAKALSEILNDGLEDAELYRTLATLRTDSPIHETLDDLEWRAPTSNLASFAQSIGETGVVRRMESLTTQR